MSVNPSKSKKQLETEATDWGRCCCTWWQSFVCTIKSRSFHNSQSSSCWNLKTLYWLCDSNIWKSPVLSLGQYWEPVILSQCWRMKSGWDGQRRNGDTDHRGQDDNICIYISGWLGFLAPWHRHTCYFSQPKVQGFRVRGSSVPSPPPPGTSGAYGLLVHSWQCLCKLMGSHASMCENWSLKVEHNLSMK